MTFKQPELKQIDLTIVPHGNSELVAASQLLAPFDEAEKPTESKSHRRKRSQYYEAEIHSSQATIEEDDLPSKRLMGHDEILKDTIGRKSLYRYGKSEVDLTPRQVSATNTSAIELAGSPVSFRQSRQGGDGANNAGNIILDELNL